MEILYMGTGASEGIPALFCHCRVCKNARKRKGNEQRTRCQALINQELMIDFGPDTYTHYLRYNFQLPDIKTLLVTHSHTDHFYATDLGMRREGLAHPVPEVLNIYGDCTVGEKFYDEFSGNERVLQINHFQEVKFFVPLDHPVYEIIPLQANHDKKESCVFYSIRERKTGKSILYAHDTGIFPEETWRFLEDFPICYGLVSLDCNSMLGKDGKNHMGYEDDKVVLNRLEKMRRVNQNTIVILNHFSHNSDVTHEEMVRAVEGTGIQIAYDGLICKI